MSQTRQSTSRIPRPRSSALGTVVGLANHTALIARDGREMPIDDCGAPIIDDRGAIAGVVLVFRDVTQRRQAEQAEAIRRVNQRMEQQRQVARCCRRVWGTTRRPTSSTGTACASLRKRCRGAARPCGPRRPAAETVLWCAIHLRTTTRPVSTSRPPIPGRRVQGCTKRKHASATGMAPAALCSRGASRCRDAAGKADPLCMRYHRHHPAQTRRGGAAADDPAPPSGRRRGDAGLPCTSRTEREGASCSTRRPAGCVGKPIGDVLGRTTTCATWTGRARRDGPRPGVIESGVADTDEKDLTASGVTRTYLASKAPYRDGHGNIIGIIGICHDITERKRVEQRARKGGGSAVPSRTPPWHRPRRCSAPLHPCERGFWSSA